MTAYLLILEILIKIIMQLHKAKHTLKEEKQLCKFYIISLETKKDGLNKKKTQKSRYM